MLRLTARVLPVLALARLPALAVAQDVRQSQGQITLSFAPVVKQTAPSVVNIYATTVVKGQDNPFSGDPVMKNLVGEGNGYFGNINLKPEQAHTISATLDLHAADRRWE